MTFAVPLGLLGLLGLPVVLVLHLFRERQRRLTISSLELWNFLKPEVHGARPRRIPLTWLLLIDLLIVVSASLALAQPRLSLAVPAQKARHMVLLVDISTSMRATDVSPSRLGQAQTEINRLLADLGPQDVVTLITFGTDAQLVSDSRQESLQVLAERAAALQAGETGHRLAEALALGQGCLDGSLPAEFHILSDGAFPDPQVGSFTQPITWHLLGRQSANQAVLEISAAETTDAPQVSGGARRTVQIFARLANFSEKPVTRVVSLLADDRLVTSTTLQMAAGEVIPQVWSLDSGPSAATVLLTGGDALSEDDVAVTGLPAAGSGASVRVTLVAESPYPLQQALTASPAASAPEVVLPADYSPSGQADLIVFRGSLPAAWPEGTVLLVDPTAPSSDRQANTTAPPNLTSAWAADEKIKIPANALLEYKESEPLLAGLDFSGVRWGEAWKLASLPEGAEVVLAADDGQGGSVPLLVRAWNGSTRILVLLVDLKTGNFSKHPAFPLFINNLVESVRGARLTATLHSGDPLPLPSAGEYRSVRIIPPASEGAQSQPQVYSGTWPDTWTQTLQPGSYRVELEDAAGRQLVQVVGVNAGDATESDLVPRSWANSLKSGTASGEAALEEPLNLTPWLAGLVGLFLLLEAALAWR